MQNLNQINIVLLPVFYEQGVFFVMRKQKRCELLFECISYGNVFLFSHISTWVKVKTA